MKRREDSELLDLSLSRHCGLDPQSQKD